VIPIAAFVRIDAGTASSSPFQRATEIVHDHAGIGVHDALETAFTLRRNMQNKSGPAPSTATTTGMRPLIGAFPQWA